MYNAEKQSAKFERKMARLERKVVRASEKEQEVRLLFLKIKIGMLVGKREKQIEKHEAHTTIRHRIVPSADGFDVKFFGGLEDFALTEEKSASQTISPAQASVHSHAETKEKQI